MKSANKTERIGNDNDIKLALQAALFIKTAAMLIGYQSRSSARIVVAELRKELIDIEKTIEE
jgi:hypothetical protein